MIIHPILFMNSFIGSFNVQYKVLLVGLYPGALSAKLKMPGKISLAHEVKPSREKRI
jgi:hypothetical protein